MPTYVYRCTKGHAFELFHAISDDGAKRCPRCRSAAKRVPAGGSGVLFRGSGFYATDYRSKDYHESAKQERAGGSAPGEPAGGKGGASPEAKPKPEAKPNPAASESGATKRGPQKSSSRRSGGRRGT